MVNKCKKCGAEFHVAHWNRAKQFCTRKCYWSSGILKKPDEQRVRIECVVCKKLCVRWEDNKNVKKFCSRKCFALNQVSVMTGKEVSPLTRKKRAEILAGKTGALSRRHIKDRTKIVQKEKKHLNGLYKEWMSLVKKRDAYKCKINNSDCSGRLESHHILDWKNYPELRYEINNGITLCHAHHPRGRKNEAELSPYFQKLVAEMN